MSRALAALWARSPSPTGLTPQGRDPAFGTRGFTGLCGYENSQPGLLPGLSPYSWRVTAGQERLFRVGAAIAGFRAAFPPGRRQWVRAPRASVGADRVRGAGDPGPPSRANKTRRTDRSLTARAKSLFFNPDDK